MSAIPLFSALYDASASARTALVVEADSLHYGMLGAVCALSEAS